MATRRGKYVPDGPKNSFFKISAAPLFHRSDGIRESGATVKLSESTPINCIIQLKKLSEPRGTNLESLIKADPDIFWARFHGGCARLVTNRSASTFYISELSPITTLSIN